MIQVSKSDIKKAMSSEQVGNIGIQELRAFVLLTMREYVIRTGLRADEAFIKETCEIFMTDLKKHYSHMPTVEIKLALEYGASGVFGDPKHISVSTFFKYVSEYLGLNERKKAKEDMAKESNVAQIEEKAGWTEAERVEKMRERYRENMQRVKDGYPVKDIGGLLFDHMEKLKLVEYTQEDQDETLMDLIEKRKSNPFDSYVRDLLKKHSQGEPVIRPYVQELILRKYFIMEIEARKIKQA